VGVWPDRRYWLWSFRLWGVLAVGFIVLTMVDGQPGDLIVVMWSIGYWAMLSLAVALALFLSRVMLRGLRRTRHFANPS